MFSEYIVPPDSKEIELERNDQEVSPSAGKNTETVLVPCRARKHVSTAISSGLDISGVSRYHFLQQFSVRVTKFTSGSNLSHLHGFQQLALLPEFIQITFFVCTNRINLLNLK